MRVGAFIMMAALVGCGEPTALPCADNPTCSGGLCIDGFCADQDTACQSGYRYGDSAGDRAGDCTGGGAGSGSGNAGPDMIYTLTNDGAPTVVDASNAHDDVKPQCAGVGGVDVMFDVSVPSGLTRLYVDTSQTDYDVVLAIYDGPCASSAKTELACIASGAGSCDARTKQWSEILNPGAYCVVIDQPAAGASHVATARAIIGPPSIAGRIGANSATTCGHNDWYPSTGCIVQSDVEDTSWFFMGCSGTWKATAGMAWVGDLEVFLPLGEPYGCADRVTGITYPQTKPGPFWLVAHQDVSQSCGTLTATITKN